MLSRSHPSSQSTDDNAQSLCVWYIRKAGYYLLVGRRFDENDDDAAADILEACDDDLVREPPPRTINQQPGLLDVLLPPANIPDDVGNIASRIDRVNHPPDDPRIGGCWLTFVVWHEHARFCASHRSR